MRIAQIAPVACRVPPKKYGGTERVVYTLTEGLVKRGHQVTLFASGDSQTSARLVSSVPKALIGTKKKDIYGLNHDTLLHLGTAYSMQDEFDIIHDHHGILSLPTANLASTPVIMPMHGPFTTANIPLYKEFTKPYLVTLSNTQLPKELKLKNHLGTVYNGLDMSLYPYSSTNDGYLLFVGRISVEKGVHKAIQVANRLKIPLIIAAKLDIKEDKEYFLKFVKPYLSKDIRWIGQVDEKKRNRLMSKALAFLHPVKFNEPFGLTLIEAMACGCPVIAFPKGSIPEIVKHGKTGYIVNSVPQMTSAVKNISNIDRLYTKKYSRKNFSANKMVEGYLDVYKKAIRTKFSASKSAYSISSTNPPQVKS